jgi:hypothetical protein
VDGVSRRVASIVDEPEPRAPNRRWVRAVIACVAVGAVGAVFVGVAARADDDEHDAPRGVSRPVVILPRCGSGEAAVAGALGASIVRTCTLVRSSVFDRRDPWSFSAAGEDIGDIDFAAER